MILSKASAKDDQSSSESSAKVDQSSSEASAKVDHSEIDLAKAETILSEASAKVDHSSSEASAKVDQTTLVSAVAKYLEGLLGLAHEVLQENGADPSRVPLFMLATGGMRLLREENNRWYITLREAITKYLNKTGFLEPTFDTISGEDEGILGWVAANYELKNFRYERGIKPKATKGFVEMGGQTAQLAFVPDSNGNYNGPVTKVVLEGQSYEVFTKSWTNLGANAMFDAHKEKLQKSDAFQKGISVKDPCWPRGHTYDLGGKTVTGTGNLIECTKEAFSLLPCPDGACQAGHPCVTRKHGGCLLGEIPGLGFGKEDSSFAGASVFYYATNGVFADGKGNSEYDLMNFWREANALFCKNWNVIKEERASSVISPDQLERAFWKAGLIMATLHMGFGVPMEQHAATCVKIAFTWYHKEAMALNEGIDPTDGLIETMCDLLTRQIPKDGWPSQWTPELVRKMVQEIFGSLLRGNSEKGMRAIEKAKQTLKVDNAGVRMVSFGTDIHRGKVPANSLKIIQVLDNLKTSFLQNTPFYDPGYNQTDPVLRSHCFDFITSFVAIVAGGESDTKVNEKYQPMRVSWTLGRMVLCAVYSQKVHNSWGEVRSTFS